MLQSDGTIFEFKMWPRDVVCLTDPLDPKTQECGDPSNTRLRATRQRPTEASRSSRSSQRAEASGRLRARSVFKS